LAEKISPNIGKYKQIPPNTGEKRKTFIFGFFANSRQSAIYRRPRITPDKAQSNLVKPSHTGQSRNKAPERWLTTDFTDGTDKK
jgi:hypothetical protein